MAKVESAGLSDVGKKRSQNQDALLVDDDLGLYAVADGMGGHRAGEVASWAVAESLHDYMKEVRAGSAPEVAADKNPDLSKPAGHLLAGLRLANSAVFQMACANPAHKGMGSTLSALYVSDDLVVAANVGDSPIYLIHGGNIELVSVPDTVFEEHKALNPGKEPDLAPEYRHMLTRAMGIEDKISAHVSEIQPFAGDCFVICSDGLTNFVEPDEICRAALSHEPGEACRILVDMANERGGDDNITVLILGIRKLIKRTGIRGFFSRLFMRGARRGG